MIPKFGSSKLCAYNTPESTCKDYRDVLTVVREKVIAMTKIEDVVIQKDAITPNTSQIDK
jgi:hypothetical protein